MSFSKQQKQGLIQSLPKNSCCRRSMLYGMLAAKGELMNDAVSLRIDGEDAIALAKRLIHEFFGRDAAVSTPHAGGRCRELTFTSASATQMISDILMDGTLSVPQKCASCRSAFLQGIFLVCGRVSDPTKQYCLEFSLGNRADIFWTTLGNMGIYLKISRKENECLLYTKNSTTIEDFFVLAGMNATAFTMMNSKIKSDIRNNANRVANCETNNIGKAVTASGRQISAIAQLERSNLLSSLPDELESTARLRLQYPDLSLSQLAAVSVPPISKSGLSHRLSRIMAFCDEMMKTSVK
ncbi:MAG: DNA-binding protein WhiA [Clostridia bacterium]|nr:DNA-binding protein WhiA [Clostridia bacterium]